MGLKIDLTQTQEVLCESCNHNTFKQSFILRKVSKFLTQTSEDSILPVTVLECMKCGTICEDALSAEVQVLFNPKPLIKNN